MAGMLPGVEAARRRRIHQNSTPGIGGVTSTPPSSARRTSFSLFCSSSSPSTLVQQRSRTQHQGDEKLGQVAREAKGRLDERLRAQRESFLITRSNSDMSDERSRNERSGENVRELRTEVYGSKENGGGGAKKLMGWKNKLGWKAGEQKECAVCLDEFKVGENLVNLVCAHRFHSRCLVPWLENHAHCPCCRISLFS